MSILQPRTRVTLSAWVGTCVGKCVGAIVGVVGLDDGFTVGSNVGTSARVGPGVGADGAGVVGAHEGAKYEELARELGWAQARIGAGEGS